MTVQPPVQFLEANGRRIAFRKRDGSSPTLVFLPGYASDMDGAKAVALDAFAERKGLAMLRLDYSGTGGSEGRFEDGSLDRWLEEALTAVDQLTAGRIILVGSSMGGWIALHVALRLQARAEAVVGIAAAPDFTDWGFGAEARATLGAKGRLGEPNPDGTANPQLLTETFWRSGQELRLLKSAIGLTCPVRLIHGQEDQDVPLDVAFRTMAALRSADVQLLVVKGGGHRLSEPHEIEAILRTVAGLLEPNP